MNNISFLIGIVAYAVFLFWNQKKNPSKSQNRFLCFLHCNRYRTGLPACQRLQLWCKKIWKSTESLLVQFLVCRRSDGNPLHPAYDSLRRTDSAVSRRCFGYRNRYQSSQAAWNRCPVPAILYGNGNDDAKYRT